MPNRNGFQARADRSFPCFLRAVWPLAAAL
jgi:hypothetical protein